MRKFLKGKDNADAYGTKISEYIEKFGGYDLSDSDITINPESIPPIRWFDPASTSTCGRQVPAGRLLEEKSWVNTLLNDPNVT